MRESYSSADVKEKMIEKEETANYYYVIFISTIMYVNNEEISP